MRACGCVCACMNVCPCICSVHVCVCSSRSMIYFSCECVQHMKTPVTCRFFNTTACYATAIKLRSKDPQPHVSLATILEELFYLEDFYGFKKEVRTMKLPIM